MLRVALFVLLAFALTASARGDDKADLKALVGKWKLEKAEVGGKDMLTVLKDLELEIQADAKYVLKLGGQPDEGSFTVDSGKTPKQMEIKGTSGPNKGKTIPAIYKIDGDTVTICYQLGGGDRPTAFESKPDTKLFLAVYKREKK
jgi:uncharacterized protein (TIGR03067 family)